MFDVQKYKNQFEKDTYYEIKVRLPKEKKQIMQELAQTTGKSINRIFIEAVEKVHHVDLTIVESKLRQPE